MVGIIRHNYKLYTKYAIQTEWQNS